MKKITTFLLLTLSATFSLTSCTKDNPTDNPNGISTGNYYPMAVDNQWTMKQDDNAIPPVKISGTDVFGGITYYKLSSSMDDSNMGSTMGFTIDSWITKKGAAYFTKIGDMTYSQDGINMEMNGYEMQVLKDDLGIGKSWTGTFPLKMTLNGQIINMTANYTGTILEKNVEATVNGISYPNVIKVDLKQEITAKDPDTGDTRTRVIDEVDWYADGVGPIKRIVTSDEKTTEAILIDYVLKK